MEGAHAPAHRGESRPQGLGLTHDAPIDAPPQTAQVVFAAGQVVGPLQAVELTAMLQQSQQPIAGVQFSGIGAADVPGRRQLGQRPQRRTDVQALIAAPMDELKELNRELDVPQPARAEFDTTVLPTALAGLVLDAAAHGTGVVDEILAAAGPPHEGIDGTRIGGAEPGVPSAWTCFEQRLEFPGGGPALVVGHMRPQGAHEGAVLALGTQSRVQRP